MATLLKTGIKNSSYGMIGQLITMVIGLLFAGMTIKYLGPGRAGFFILVSAIFGWVQLAGGGAFQAPAVQKLASLSLEKERNKFHEIIRTVVTANIAVGVPFSIAAIILFPTLFSWSQLDEIYRNNALIVVVLGSIGFLLEQYSSGLSAVYEGLQRFDIIAILKSSFGIFGNLARLLVLIYFRDMASLAIANIIIVLIKVLVDIILINRLVGGGIIPGWKWSVLRPLLSFGLWTWLGNTGNVIFINLTGVVLAKYLGTAALIYVSLPQSIVLQVGQLIIASSYFLFPAFANEGAYVEKKIRSVEDRMRWFISLMSFAIFTGLFLAGPKLLMFLVDSSYALHATLPLSLFCLYGIIWAQEIFYVFSIMATAKNLHVGTIVHLVISFSMLGATALLIPKIGYIGLPIAQLLKLLGVIWLTILGRHVLNLSLSFKRIVSPFISPLAGAGLWILLIYGFRFLNYDSIILEIFVWIIGALLYLGTVCVLEMYIFSKQNRLVTLFLALTLISEKISPRLSFKLKSMYQ